MLKKIGVAVLLLIVAIGGGLFWLRGNMDSLVKNAIEKYGSEMTKATVKVASVEIKPADGRSTIHGLSIGNPAGFKTDHALNVAVINVDIDIATVAKDVVTIRKIEIVAPDIIYEKGDSQTNFDALQKNIADYVGPAEKKDNSSGKKLIVTELVVRDAKANANAAFMGDTKVSVGLPNIALHDLGKAKGGVTGGELGQEIVNALKQQLSKSLSFDNLSKSAVRAQEKAASAIKGLFGK